MTEQTYKIRYKCGSSEIEIEGDKQFVDEKFQFLLKEIKVDPISTQQRSTENPSTLGTTGRKPHIKELIAEKQPSAANQVAVIIAYYLFKFEGKENFIDADIKKLWTVSGCKPLKALSQMLVDCKNEKGWFDSVSRGVYKINEHGIYFVESELPTKK